MRFFPFDFTSSPSTADIPRSTRPPNDVDPDAELRSRSPFSLAGESAVLNGDMPTQYRTTIDAVNAMDDGERRPRQLRFDA